MFAKPGTYDMIMRYSSLTPKLLPDNLAAPRGIGMKIFGVEGEKIWGEDKNTQDWTFNVSTTKTPMTSTSDKAHVELPSPRASRPSDHLRDRRQPRAQLERPSHIRQRAERTSRRRCCYTG